MRREMTRRQVLRWGAAFSLGGVSVSEAEAQDTGEETRTLAEILPKVDWNPMVRGPLFIVDPERSRRDPKLPLPSPVRSLYNLRTIAPVYGRTLLGVGTLTVAIPTTITVLDDSLRQPPNLYAGLPYRSALHGGVALTWLTEHIVEVTPRSVA
jgi:hypothetical protein